MEVVDIKDILWLTVLASHVHTVIQDVPCAPVLKQKDAYTVKEDIM